MVDNDLLEANNLNINQHHINPENVNCTDIIDVERSKTDNQRCDNISPAEQREADCFINVYRGNGMFDWKLALKQGSVTL